MTIALKVGRQSPSHLSGYEVIVSPGYNIIEHMGLCCESSVCSLAQDLFGNLPSSPLDSLKNIALCLS